MDPQYEQRLRDEVIYLHSLWHQGPPKSTAATNHHHHLQPKKTTPFKKEKKPNKKDSKTDPNLSKWQSPPSPPPSTTTTAWQKIPKHPLSSSSLSPERNPKLVPKNPQVHAFNVVREFFKSKNGEDSDGIDSSDDDEDEDDDDDELMEEDYGCDDYSFFSKLLMEDDEGLKENYVKNFVEGEFSCLVCGALRGKGSGKKFRGCLGLVQHTKTIAKRRRAHRAFGQAVCKVLGWDIDQLPAVGSWLSELKSSELEGNGNGVNGGVVPETGDIVSTKNDEGDVGNVNSDVNNVDSVAEYNGAIPGIAAVVSPWLNAVEGDTGNGNGGNGGVVPETGDIALPKNDEGDVGNVNSDVNNVDSMTEYNGIIPGIGAAVSPSLNAVEGDTDNVNKNVESCEGDKVVPDTGAIDSCVRVEGDMENFSLNVDSLDPAAGNNGGVATESAVITASDNNNGGDTHSWTVPDANENLEAFGTGHLPNTELSPPEGLTTFPFAVIQHLPAIGSDHNPLLLKLKESVSKGPRPFRFEIMWVRDESCKDVISNSWSIKPIASPQIRFISKSGNTRKALARWNKESFGNTLTRERFLIQEIDSIQRGHQSSEAIRRGKQLQLELDEIRKKNAVLWRQRAKESWLKDGDENTRFFHISTVIKSKVNRIVCISNTDGSKVTNWNEVGQCFQDFFQSLFTSDLNEGIPTFPDNLDLLFDKVINDDDNASLCSTPSAHHIKKVVFQMDSFKSPGPDGFPPFFYKNYWDIVGQYVIKAVQSFFASNFLPTAFNHTFIALIPKDHNADKVDRFRPISLCNVIYKTISKILADRLKGCLSKIISPFQFAFLEGRQIHENNIVTHELMHYIKNKRGPKAFMAFKVDLTKAYDRVEWPLLIKILENLGFCSTFCAWILNCISSCSFSTLINGTPFGLIKPSRGIRQGDPISPYLFVVYIEILSRLIAREEAKFDLKGIKISRESPPISHLLFADDLTFFCRAEMKDVDAINKCLKVLEQWGSQIINKEKSFVHFSNNTHPELKKMILTSLEVQECKHKNLHLGIPFCKPRRRKEAFFKVIQSLQNQLAGWKGTTLSQTGRGVLLKSVIQAMPTYQMANFLLPASITNKIDSLMLSFWWGENDRGNILSLKCWDSLCLPKNCGGLGFRKAKDMNKALVSKNSWYVAAKTNRLWVSLFRNKYVKNRNFFSMNKPSNCSWIATDIFIGREIISNGACFSVNSSSDIDLWNDPWIPTISGSSIPMPISSNVDLDQFKEVKDLFASHGTCWNSELVQTIFSPSIASAILRTPIFHSSEPKVLLWTPSKSGVFSTKSSYLQSIKSKIPDIPHPIWRQLWRSRVHERHKLFWWKCLSDSIPTRSRINSIFRIEDSTCPLCHIEDETIEHLFMRCHVAKILWFCSKWNFRLEPFADFSFLDWFSLFLNCRFDFLTTEQDKLEFVIFGAVTMNCIWKLRNQVIHQDASFDQAGLIRVIHEETQSHTHSQSLKTTLTKTSQAAIGWIKPPRGWLKINVDAAFKNFEASSAMVWRNSAGSITFAASDIFSCIDPCMAEARALLDAVSKANLFQKPKIIFESDCLELINFINYPMMPVNWSCKSFVIEIRRYWACWPKWRFRFTPRSNNSAAHFLAEWAGSHRYSGAVPFLSLPVNIFCDGGFPIWDPLFV